MAAFRTPLHPGTPVKLEGSEQLFLVVFDLGQKIAVTSAASGVRSPVTAVPHDQVTVAR